MFKLKIRYLDKDKLSINSDFNNKIYEDETIKLTIKDIKIDECHFKKVDFTDINLIDVEFIDVMFEDLKFDNIIDCNRLHP